MPLVGSFFVDTYATVGGAKSSSISPTSTNPKHVIELRNCTTLTQSVTVDGQILGSPPLLALSGGSAVWSSGPRTVYSRSRIRPEHQLTHLGVTGSEDLACVKLEETSVHASSPTTYLINVSRRVNVT